MRESYKVEMSCELASHKEFRHACLRSVIAPKIVYFVGFLIMSPLADTIAANSGGRRCKEKRKVGHTSKGFQNRCSTIQTRLGLRKPSMYGKRTVFPVEICPWRVYTNTKLFCGHLLVFRKVIPPILLILANDLGKCPTAKISSANFLLIALE